MVSQKFTDHLLTLHPSTFKEATQHPFLYAAGAGFLSSKSLCEWLVQDKYYQFAYVQFIGRSLSKVDLTSFAFVSQKDSDKNLQWKTFNVLAAMLAGIRAEIEFYNQTVEKYRLPIEPADPDVATRSYKETFEQCSAVGEPLLLGLTVLWATEYVYLKAWSYAKEQMGSASTSEIESGRLAALRSEFIPNWTSDEFKAAVDAIAEVVDLWAEKESDEVLQRCEQLWLQVLELEAKFWPPVD